MKRYHQNRRAEVERLRDEMQVALDGNDMDTLKEKLDALEQAAHTMSEQMYQQQADAGQTSESSAAHDDNVVDADFTEKN